MRGAKKNLQLIVASVIFIFFTDSLVSEAFAQPPRGRDAAIGRSSAEGESGTTNQNREGQPDSVSSPNKNDDNTGLPMGASESSKNGFSSAERWGVITGLGIVATGLIILSFFTFMLHRNMKRIEEKVRTTGLSTLVQPLTGKAKPATSENARSQDMSVDLLKIHEQMQILSMGNTRLGERVETLEQKLEELKHKFQDPKELPTNSLTISKTQLKDDVIVMPPGVQPPIHVTVDKMLEWAKNAGLSLKTVKADFSLFGNFSPSDEGDNWLAIGPLVNDEPYLFPRASRFETASHYNTLYSEYYNCDHPSAGTILIEQPAVVAVDSEQGGWKLLNKGKLSVAS